MKIRNGFVSNSSSSSFVCEICGETESGMDISLEEFGMFACKNSHYMHEECAKKHMDKKEYNKLINLLNGENEDEENEDENEENEEYDEEIRYEGVDPKLCPCCQLKVLTTDDELAYYRKKLNTTNKETQKELKEKFGDIDGLYKFVKD